MKILFYNRGDEHLGIESLSAVAKKAGHQTSLIYDLGFEDIFFVNKFRKMQDVEKLVLQALAYEPDMIAISATTLAYHAAKLFSRRLREKKNILTIIGGPHATACPEEVLNEDCFDMVLIGEGEDAFLELIESYGRGKKYDVRNVWFKVDGSIIKNPLRPLIQDLDRLPFLDREIFYQCGAITDRLGILCARGCFYSCSYCTHSYTRELYKNNCAGYNADMDYVRLRSPGNVIKEILFCMGKYKFKSIRFWDEMFGYNYSWLQEFSKDYIRYVNLPFVCTTHSSLMNDERVALLKKTNCRNITIGVESGSSEVRKGVLGRNTPDALLLKAAEIVKRHNINLITENIFCLPNEEKAHMDDTVALNMKMRPKNAGAFIFFPFPRTKLFNFLLENKLLDEKVAQEIILGSPSNNSWHKRSIIKHPHADYAWRLKVSLPLIIRYPALAGLFKELTKIRILSSFLFYWSLIYVDNTEFRQKFKDYINIFITKLRQGRL